MFWIDQLSTMAANYNSYTVVLAESHELQSRPGLIYTWDVDSVPVLLPCFSMGSVLLLHASKADSH